jgi:hypothetical protein
MFPIMESHMPVADFLYSSSRIPFAARLFDTTLRFGFLQFNSQFDNLRFSSGDQPDSSSAPLLVKSIASADQLVVVMFEELLCVFLTGSQCSPS